MRFIFSLMLFVVFASNAFSQQLQDTIEARIQIIQNKITKSSSQIAVISISFENHSDVDLYIPEIYKVSSGSRGGFIKIYRKKQSSDFEALPFYGGAAPESGSAVSGYANRIHRIYDRLHKKYDETYIDAIRNAKHSNLDTNIIFKYESRPLYLKSKETVENFYIVSIDEDILNNTGEYKISYEPELKFSKANLFPDKILNYKKYLPTFIKSNLTYIKVEE